MKSFNHYAVRHAVNKLVTKQYKFGTDQLVVMF